MKTKQEIFDTLISEELGVLRAAAYRLLGDPAEVDDAVQEALLTAWNKFDQFRRGAKLSTWVYRITVNLCCDRIRRRKREAEKLKAYAQESAADRLNYQLFKLIAFGLIAFQTYELCQGSKSFATF